MKLKSLFFGSAAALMVVTGAQAADLPAAAEPVDYVRVCDAFGTGFFYIPGTETCLKIGGYVRVEAHFTEGGRNTTNNYTTRARGTVNFDARTQTDIGLVRAYFQYLMTVGPADTVNYAGTGAILDQAYVQISNDMGTFTAGHASSFFDFWASNNWGTRVGTDDPTGSSTLFAYTFNVGNGVSASLSLEDPASQGRRAFVGDAGRTNPAGDGLYGGQRFPDLVGNVRIDQGWGSAQVMGALHQVRSVYANVGSEIGWAVGAGLSVKVPGTGIKFDTQGTYAKGAVAYATALAPAGLSDGDMDGGGDELSEAWSVRTGLSADFTSTVTATLSGSYTSYDQLSTGSSDFNAWAVAGNLQWKPVSGLVIGGELAYRNVELFTAGGVSTDADIWGGMIRVQRSF